MRPSSVHQRVVVGADLDLEFLPLAANGQPRDPAPVAGDLAVAVTRVSDGATITPGSISAPTSPGHPATATIAAADNNSIDELVATWTLDGVDHTRRVLVVGGAYVDIDTIETAGHAPYPALTQASDPDRKVRARSIAEIECERITGRAWVPHMRRHTETVRGVGFELLVPDTDVRTLRSVQELSADGATITKTWTAAELAAVKAHEHGVFERLGSQWSNCLTTLVYDFGLDAPPFDLQEAVAKRYLYWLTRPESGVPDKAISWSSAEGGTFRISTPGPGRTGDPDVDAVYLDYSADDDQLTVPW